ncbi:ESPR-type extended signal peptide-containing protein, partial [Neisseria mucosa]|uniref:ESPR-type extended signal peptide-containing protein n=1 Tax=Neisseria mucosa TaxID=488 RepID=UPI00280ABB7E
MNKIFKVVWNRTIGSFVVTSELAKGHVKSSSEGSEGDVRASGEGRLKTLFRLTALSAALLGFSEGAWATIPEGSVTGGAVLAIGTGSTVANGTGAMSIGHNAQAKTNGALAIAPNSTHTTISNGNNSIAIGVNLRADGTKAIGIGTDTTVNGTGAIAIGNNDSGRMANQGVNGNGAIGVGSNLTARGINAIAVGAESQATANYALAIGSGTQATGEDSIAIGKSEGTNLAQATTKQSLAIGWTAKATGATQAVAIGPDAIASGTQSTSIGNNTRATGDSSIAIGGDDWNIVRTKQVAAAGNKQVHQVYQELTGMEMKEQGERFKNPFKGTTAGDAAVAIGVAALAEGTLSTAFGSGTSASGVGASAFGVGATASKDKSVAIGAGSHTNTDATRETTATVNGITYSGFAGADHITSGSQVSFGSAGFERQLKHVAPGAIASTSTDAVNGSQLFAIAKDMRAAQTHFYSVKSEDHTKGNYNNDGAKGEHSLAAGEEASATANSATAVGQKALASGEAAIAVGSETKAAASNAVVIGNRASVEEVASSADSGTTTGLGSVAVGAVSKASGTNATAIGQAANAFGQNSFAGGQASKALGKSSVALGDGANAIKDSAVALGAYTNANNAGATAVGFNSNALGWASFAGGHSARAEASSAVALGHQAQAVGGKAVAIGKDSHAAKEGAIALGDGAKATKGNSVAIGAGSTTATDATIVNEAKVNDLKYSGFAGGSKVTAGDQVSFGSAGHERQLKHVAPGDISKDSTDAINGSQLYAVQSVLGNTAKTVKNVLGGNAKVGEDGSITMSNIGDTGAENIHNAIKSVKETAEKGWNLKANDDADSEKIAAGDTVTVKQGKNIRVKRSGKELTVETSDDVEFANVKAASVETASVVADSVIAGNSVLTTDGLKIGADSSPNQVSLTTAGLNNGGNKITKVAEGTLAADSTDAVNGAQLYKVDQKADTNAGNIAKGINIGGTSNSNKYGLGDTVNIKGDSNIVSDTVKGGVQLKLADTVKIGQDSGKPVSIDGVNGTVSGLSNTTLGNAPLAGSNKAATEAQLDATQANLRTILGGNAANNNGNVTIGNIGDTGKANIHDAIKSVKETAEKGWKLKVNEETSAQAEKISPDDEVAIKQGKNITVTRDGKNITVATSEDVEFNTVNATTAIAETVIAGNSVLNTDGLKIGDDSSPNQVSLTTSGLNNGGNKIAKVAKGMEDTDGVNVSQIKPLATALNTTVGADGSIAEPNFTVNHADGTAGTPVHTVQDALNEVGKELNKGLNIVADNGSSEKVNLGDTVTYTSKDKNIVTTSGTGKAIDFSLAEKVTIGKDAANGGKPVVIDGKEGIVSGLTNTTLGSAPLVGSDKAATEAQLDATQVNLATILGGNAANNNGNVTTNNIGETGANNVHDAIKSVKETAEKGWNLKANDETDSD